MRVHSLSAKDWGKAIGVGIGVALLLSAIMVPAAKMGISPLPKPLGLAFAETILVGDEPARPAQSEGQEGGRDQPRAGGQPGDQAQNGGPKVPLPVGLAFHVAYVTFWSVVFVVLFRDNLSFVRALALGLALWVAVLIVFFPVVGWGFLGLAQGPMLILGALVPHVLFAVFLWLGCRLAFGNRAEEHGSPGPARRIG